MVGINSMSLLLHCAILSIIQLVVTLDYALCGPPQAVVPQQIPSQPPLASPLPPPVIPDNSAAAAASDEQPSDPETSSASKSKSKLSATVEAQAEEPETTVNTSDQRKQRPQTRLNANHEGTRGGCNPEKEFHCKLEDRCVPLEWRCDFTKQCLGGQDELGCVAAWCDFDRDNCYWLNSIQQQQEHYRAQPSSSIKSLESENLSGELKSENLSGELKSANRPEIVQKQSFWRRYSAQPSNSELQSGKQNQQYLQEQKHQTKQDQQEQGREQRKGQNDESGPTLVSLLADLNSESDGRAKFIFVPLSLNAKDLTGLQPGQSSSSAAQPEQQFIKRASIMTPTIGRTNSMCQLRFEYALWTSKLARIPPTSDTSDGHHDDHNGPNLDGDRKSQVESLRPTSAKTTLSLLAHLSGQAQPKSIWSRSLDWRQPVGLDQLANSPEAAAIGWTVGVAELGHLKQVELSFEASLLVTMKNSRRRRTRPRGETDGNNRNQNGQLCNATDSSGSGVVWSSKSEPGSAGRASGREQVWRRRVSRAGAKIMEFRGALVALRRLNFHDCHWPGGEQAPELMDEEEEVPLPGGHYGYYDGSADEDGAAMGVPAPAHEVKTLPTGSGGSPLIDGAGVDIGAITGSWPCAQDEFKCPNGLCLQAKKLCNFVNDCMTNAAWPGQVAPGGSQVLIDDESSELCNSMLGAETFDAPSPIRRQLQLFLTNRPDKFWHLTGSWPIDKTSVRNNAQHLAHLPQTDHTTRTELGKFLSLEIPTSVLSAKPASLAPRQNDNPSWPTPAMTSARDIIISSSSNSSGGSGPGGTGSQSTGTNTSGRRKVYWASINSHWMRKLDDEFGECRLKFFYNLVASPVPPVVSSSLSSHAPSVLPFQVSIVVEHYTLAAAAAGGSSSNATDTFCGRAATRKVDAFMHSAASPTLGDKLHRKEAVRLLPIELAGVDYWREANYRLGNLNAGDTFYVRLLLFVELDEPPPPHRLTTDPSLSQPRQPLRASINFDDLSTHFGCGPATLDAYEPSTNQQLAAASGEFRQVNSFDGDLLDYLRPDEPATSERPVDLGTRYIPYRNRLKRHHYDGLDQDSCADGLSRGVEIDASGSATHKHKSSHLSQVEPQQLIAYVLGAFFVMVGFIAIIVFVLVPRVERAMMNYQGQIQLSLSGEISDLPITQAHIYDLNSSSLSTPSRHAHYLHNNHRHEHRHRKRQSTFNGDINARALAGRLNNLSLAQGQRLSWPASSGSADMRESSLSGGPQDWDRWDSLAADAEQVSDRASEVEGSRGADCELASNRNEFCGADGDVSEPALEDKHLGEESEASRRSIDSNEGTNSTVSFSVDESVVAGSNGASCVNCNNSCTQTSHHNPTPAPDSLGSSSSQH